MTDLSNNNNNSNNNSNQSIGLRLFNMIKPQFSTVDKLQMKTQFNFQNIFNNVNFQQQAKDLYGNLHPQYQQPIQNGCGAIKDYIDLYTNDILNGIRQIDFLCIKTAYRKIDNYQKCKEQTNIKIHKEIIIPLVNASALLYKVSNQCLLKGNSVQVCSGIVADHSLFTFKLAAEKIKAMTIPMMALVPEDVKPAHFAAFPINNQIVDQIIEKKQ